MPTWAENTGTQAEVEMLILDTLCNELPRPHFTDDETGLRPKYLATCIPAPRAVRALKL